jgi:plastocyanin
MNAKFAVLILVLVSVLLSGCAGENETLSEPETTPAETETTDSTELPDELQTDEFAHETEQETYMVRMEYYEMMKPSELPITKGDLVSWWNYKKQGSYTLVSEDGLFEDTELLYLRHLNYTFEETGTYRFSVEGLPHMNMTVTVE